MALSPTLDTLPPAAHLSNVLLHLHLPAPARAVGMGHRQVGVCIGLHAQQPCIQPPGPEHIVRT